MSSQMTSHPLPILVLVLCLVLMAAPMIRTAKINSSPSKRRINCARYVFHPTCRGISAKRSSVPSFSSPSSSSSSSSSSRLFRSLPEDMDRTELLNRLVLSSNTNNGRIEDVAVAGVAPSSLQQQQQQRHVFPYDKDTEWRRQLLRVLLMELGAKDSDPRDAYDLYPGLDIDST